jgi:hypothetical protein
VNVEECSQRLRTGGSKFSFDTNALYADRRLIEVCGNVSRWNDRLKEQGRPPVYLAVCTVAHAEKLFDLKKQYGSAFNPETIAMGLQSKGLRIEPFEVKHALETANRLGTFYPAAQDWHQAKKKLCLECAGLDPSKHQEAIGTGKQCGATVDWLIGAHALAEGYVLVTDDRGLEFKQLESVKLNTLVAAVQQVLSEPV